MAIGALRAARERGVPVPEGLAVVGMDDIEVSAYTDPPLTTVRIPKDTMGRLAAERLIALVEGDGAGWTAPPVTGELVIRGTCGGAPGTRIAPGVRPSGATTPGTEGA
jgi:DNA-binding LacI/PurR family transcriptional regulator